MPGKKKSKTARHRKEVKDVKQQQRELVVKEHGQEYGQVLKPLGERRFEALCFDGKTRLVHVRGKMRKRSWVTVGDVILVALRDFQDDKADIILKYTAEEVNRLKAMGEVPESTEVRDQSIFGASDEEQPAGEIEVNFEEI